MVGVSKISTQSVVGDPTRGVSSVGRAPALQAGCQRFKSATLHISKVISKKKFPTRSQNLFVEHLK